MHQTSCPELRADAFADAARAAIARLHPVVVAIPAKNESERIGACLTALTRQSQPPDEVLLLANDCTDATIAVAKRCAGDAPFRLSVVAHRFSAGDGSAGLARRLAMAEAAAIAGPAGILLTTDADSVAASDWVERNLLALSAGADVVCGRAVIDPVEARLIPQHLHEDDRRECELIELLDRIAAEADPDPADPWPRHTEASGASLAVTVEAFREVGGIPPVAAGEDRAFVRALEQIDARIRHDPSVVVTVSGRTEGRAAGGMADTMRRRMQQQDEFADDMLEPAVDAYRRVDFRRRLREVWDDPTRSIGMLPELATDLGIPAPELRKLVASRYFGAAWSQVQGRSPFLVRRRVRFIELPRQIAYARQLLHTQGVPCP